MCGSAGGRSCVFAALGLTLEVFHGFKVAAYLDVSNETRRLMWRLAHAHGVLLGLIHVVYGLALGAIPGLGGPNAGLVTTALIGASLLLPGGFFLGGVAFYGGDPGSRNRARARGRPAAAGGPVSDRQEHRSHLITVSGAVIRVSNLHSQTRDRGGDIGLTTDSKDDGS